MKPPDALLPRRPSWAPWVCTAPTGHDEVLKRSRKLPWKRYWLCLNCGCRTWSR